LGPALYLVLRTTQECLATARAVARTAENADGSFVPNRPQGSTSVQYAPTLRGKGRCLWEAYSKQKEEVQWATQLSLSSAPPTTALCSRHTGSNPEGRPKMNRLASVELLLSLACQNRIASHRIASLAAFHREGGGNGRTVKLGSRHPARWPRPICSCHAQRRSACWL